MDREEIEKWADILWKRYQQRGQRYCIVCSVPSEEAQKTVDGPICPYCLSTQLLEEQGIGSYE